MRVVAYLAFGCALIPSPYVPIAVAQAPALAAARTVGPLADSLRVFALVMGDMLRQRDAKGTMALYGDRSHFVHIDNGNVIPWPQLSEMMTSYFSTAKTNPVSLVGEPGVTILDENSAVVYVTHHAAAHEGRPAHVGVWTGVLRRFADGWKIVHSHSSDRRPE